MRRQELLDQLRRVMVAIDPAATHGEGADDTGIVVVARGPHWGDRCKLWEATGRCPGHGYVLDDLTCHVPPHQWAQIAVGAYDRWKADRIVAETNNGGDMVGEVIHAVRAGVNYEAVTASRGKHNRAEPVAALDEQGRLHYVGEFRELEMELTSWTQDSDWSPNRLDAMVWGFTALGLIGGQGQAFAAYLRRAVKGETRAPDPDRLAQRELDRRMRRTPRLNGEPDSWGPRRGCEHRWRGDRCVLCGGMRSN